MLTRLAGGVQRRCMTRPQVRPAWVFAPVLALMAAGGSCTSVSTKIQSFPDSAFRGHVYKRLLVVADLPHLDQQTEMETVFAKHFEAMGVTCLRSIDLLPPTREHPDEDFFLAVRENQIDGVLRVQQTEYYEEHAYVPPKSKTRTTGTFSGNTFHYGGMSNAVGHANAVSRTRTTGGYYVNQPCVRHRVDLCDVATRKIAWIGSAFTEGDASAEFSDLVDSLAEETARTLNNDGLLQTKTSTRPGP
jgi:hypothetical protein